MQVAFLQHYWVGKYLQRWTIAHQPALLQKQNTLRKTQREIKVMRNKEQHIQFRQTAQVFHKGNVRAIVLSCRGLVNRKDLSLHRQHGGNRTALLPSETPRNIRI